MYLLKKTFLNRWNNANVARDKTCLENLKIDLDFIEHLWTKSFQKNYSNQNVLFEIFKIGF